MPLRFQAPAICGIKRRLTFFAMIMYYPFPLRHHMMTERRPEDTYGYHIKTQPEAIAAGSSDTDDGYRIIRLSIQRIDRRRAVCDWNRIHL
jgi:hypothetical protein